MRVGQSKNKVNPTEEVEPIVEVLKKSRSTMKVYTKFAGKQMSTLSTKNDRKPSKYSKIKKVSQFSTDSVPNPIRILESKSTVKVNLTGARINQGSMVQYESKTKTNITVESNPMVEEVTVNYENQHFIGQSQSQRSRRKVKVNFI